MRPLLLAVLLLGCAEAPTIPEIHPLVGVWVSHPKPYRTDEFRGEAITKLTLRQDGTASLEVVSADEDVEGYPLGAVVVTAVGVWQERDGRLACVWDQVDGDDAANFQLFDVWWWPDRIAVGRDRIWVFRRQPPGA